MGESMDLAGEMIGPSAPVSRPTDLSVDGLDALAATARWTAAERARESARPDRLFDDPYAAVLAGEPGHALAERMRGGGTWDNPTIAVRTRFFDDALADAGGAEQVVLLAAGMDTRAYRLDLPAATVVFELDRPELLALKDDLLETAAAKPRCTRRPVDADLSADWPAALIAAGFRADRPSVWLVEGLFAYLGPAAANRLLDRITDLSAPGCLLLADMVGRSLLDSPWMRPWLDQLAAQDMAWGFGTDQPEDLLTLRGWHPDVTTMSAAGVRLGRWPFPDLPRGTPGVPHSYLIHATR